MNIWILDSDSGITLLYKAFLDMNVDEDLVSGLLTALNQFTKMEFKQGIDSVDMGGLKWVYLEDKETSLLFIAADSKDVNSDILKGRLNVIKQEFLLRFVKDKTQWHNLWKGNVKIFDSFRNLIDEYYSQWKQVEKISTLAEYFDILGIFQQILNLIFNIIEGHISGVAKEAILSHIEHLFAYYSKHEIMKKEPELNKITFQRNVGINIISINPDNSDMITVEKHIINIIENIIKKIKKEIGYISWLNFFIKEKVLDYIISNISMLNEFNLLKFLMQLFLLE
jgi:hypothetical protein